jgi:hypothetical protein
MFSKWSQISIYKLWKHKLVVTIIQYNYGHTRSTSCDWHCLLWVIPAIFGSVSSLCYVIFTSLEKKKIAKKKHIKYDGDNKVKRSRGIGENEALVTKPASKARWRSPPPAARRLMNLKHWHLCSLFTQFWCPQLVTGIISWEGTNWDAGRCSCSLLTYCTHTCFKTISKLNMVRSRLSTKKSQTQIHN